MKTRFLTTLAAALIACVAGLTLAATAAAGVPKKLKLYGACAEVYGGTFNKMKSGNYTGWSTKLCVLHTVSTQNPEIGFRGEGHASFKKYVGLTANSTNLKKCASSRVLLRFYKRTSSGNWMLLRKERANAAPKFITGGKITSCQVSVVTWYFFGGNQYRTIVMAIDGDGKNKGNLIRSAIGS